MALTETTLEPFLRAPVGKWVALPTVVIWCASRTFVGGIAWGSPSEEDTRLVTYVFDHYEILDVPFSILIDARRMTGFAPGALTTLFGWLFDHRKELLARLRLQGNLIERGPVGFIAAGMLNAMPNTHPTRSFTDRDEAFTALGGPATLSLANELDEIVERVRGVPPEMASLRALLVNDIEVSLERAAVQIGISTRSLQRVLGRHGSSFKDEVAAARLVLAQALLESTDDKLATVAARVGISERALTTLFRSRTELSPAEWRKSRSR